MPPQRGPAHAPARRGLAHAPARAGAAADNGQR
jgi:hypothetical protein